MRATASRLGGRLAKRSGRPSRFMIAIQSSITASPALSDCVIPPQSISRSPALGLAQRVQSIIARAARVGERQLAPHREAAGRGRHDLERGGAWGAAGTARGGAAHERRPSSC